MADFRSVPHTASAQISLALGAYVFVGGLSSFAGWVFDLPALTGWGQAEDRAKAKDAGFDDHLVKPVEPSALNQLLARANGSPGASE